ncbi:MAG: glycosyltransferase family 39 protein [Planctomycetaceae bacterium]|nr:glycosyltransferase family 39 protein [Planctomycetaceae bacterium]
MSSHRKTLGPKVCGVLATCITLGIFLIYYSVKFGLNHPPGATGDEPIYDSIGWELAHGRGFRLDFQNAEFRQPYDQAAKSSELYQLTTESLAGTVADRPPVLPFVMSILDRTFGRQFWGIRFVNAFCMAAVCGLLVAFVCQLTDARIALISGLLYVVVDTRTRFYGRTLLTEPLTTLAVAILCWLLFRMAQRPSLKQAVCIGGMLGVALLTRSQIILWTPVLLLIVFWLAFRQPPVEPGASNERLANEGTRRLRRAVLFTATAVGTMLMVAGPWMMRNCRVLGEFMPLGSQGWVQLSAAFGDAIWANHGVWVNLDSDGFFQGVTQPGMTRLESEVVLAHESRRRAMEWIAANPGKAVALAPMKVFQEFRPRTIPQWTILTLSIMGTILSLRDDRTRILLGVIASCCVAIALTWSVEGRFIVPLLFAQHALIGLGMNRLFSKTPT